MLFLQTAPLVEREWVDAYVVELAEWGALLRKKGLVFKDADDNSPFAWERIGKVTKEGSRRPTSPHYGTIVMPLGDVWQTLPYGPKR